MSKAVDDYWSYTLRLTQADRKLYYKLLAYKEIGSGWLQEVLKQTAENALLKVYADRQRRLGNAVTNTSERPLGANTLNNSLHHEQVARKTEQETTIL